MQCACDMHFVCCLVNSEANARRIAFVEHCFGSSGLVQHAFNNYLLIFVLSFDTVGWAAGRASSL